MSQRRAHRAAQTPRLCDDMVENGQDDGASTQKLHILLLLPLLLRDVPAYYDTSTFFRFFFSPAQQKCADEEVVCSGAASQSGMREQRAHSSCARVSGVMKKFETFRVYRNDNNGVHGFCHGPGALGDDVLQANSGHASNRRFADVKRVQCFCHAFRNNCIIDEKSMDAT